jgi:hypothetical protein
MSLYFVFPRERLFASRAFVLSSAQPSVEVCDVASAVVSVVWCSVL